MGEIQGRGKINFGSEREETREKLERRSVLFSMTGTPGRTDGFVFSVTLFTTTIVLLYNGH